MAFSLFDNQQVIVHEDEETFAIRYRWFKPSVVTTVVIPVVLVGLPCLVIFHGDAKMEETSDWLAAMLLVSIWLLATYVYLAALLNSTWITLDPENLSTRHGPLPWRGKSTLPRKQVQWLEPKRRRESQMEDGGEIITITFEVIAILEGRQVTLINRVSDFELASKISQLANRRLKLLNDS